MDKKLTNIKERILYYSKFQGISIENFLASIDMTYGSFKREAKKRSLNSDAIEKILTIYSDVNPMWLITGEGEMIKDNKQAETKFSERVNIAGAEIIFVPLVSKYAYREYLENYDNQAYISSLNQVPWVNDFKREGKSFMTFEIRGDRMNDNSAFSLLDGDLVLSGELEDHTWVNLAKSKSSFVILHKEEGVIVTKILNYDTESNSLQCHNLNPFYANFNLDLNKVIKIFKVLELIREPRF